IKEHSVPVRRDEWLDRQRGVKKDGTRITAITTLSGKTFLGKVFIDATYEGDLMAAAGVGYHVGREANSVYGERYNGVQTGVPRTRHHVGVLKTKISPLRHARRPQKRRAAAHQHERPGQAWGRGQARAGLLLPHVPDRPRRQPGAVRQTGGVRPRSVRAAR